MIITQCGLRVHISLFLLAKVFFLFALDYTVTGENVK